MGGLAYEVSDLGNPLVHEGGLDPPGFYPPEPKCRSTRSRHVGDDRGYRTVATAISHSAGLAQPATIASISLRDCRARSNVGTSDSA